MRLCEVKYSEGMKNIEELITHTLSIPFLFLSHSTGAVLEPKLNPGAAQVAMPDAKNNP